jgi:hypothetical protein
MAKKNSKDAHRIKGSKEKQSLMASSAGGHTFKDIKRRAISLGMPFPDAAESDYFALSSYIHKSTNKPDNSLIDKYDQWVEKQLDAKGVSKTDPIRNYMLKLGFIAEDPEGGPKKVKRPRGLERPKKPKREKDAIGLWKGTKKSYTFELALRGMSLERTTRRVLKKFPDANPKSICQWHRAALRKKPHESQEGV